MAFVFISTTMRLGGQRRRIDILSMFKDPMTTTEVVGEALKRIKRTKAIGLDNLSIKM